jgi:hypothetical protein
VPGRAEWVGAAGLQVVCGATGLVAGNWADLAYGHGAVVCAGFKGKYARVTVILNGMA